MLLNEIIEGCKKDDRRSQEELYRAFASAMLGVCMRYAKDQAEAEDILQEGFLKVFQNIKKYNGEGAFANWVKTIMVNTSISNYHKSKKHYHHEDIDEMDEKESRHDQTPENDYSAKELNNLLKRLPEGYRMVFNLYAIEGYKHKEIAEKLSIDVNTSKTQYLRARNWLQKEMERLGAEYNG
jgi:RNA polymerase sigma-70 factor (ECF subfamily)